MEERLTIGEAADRTGVATSALRFYEDEGLLSPDRTPAGHRRYPRRLLRRIAFIRAAQEVGIGLAEVHAALQTLPDGRTPDERDWARLSAGWRGRLDERIAALERLRDRLDECIGCGCLSLQTCRIVNPEDAAAAAGPGSRLLRD
jgi:MerR family redox-sensitive transcriptional activator SoxR